MVSDDDGGIGGIASRRGFLGGGMLLASTALALAAPAAGPARAAPAARSRRPVIALHADQLYLDYSGATEAFVAPHGLRTLDDQDEEALRHLVYTL